MAGDTSCSRAANATARRGSSMLGITMTASGFSGAANVLASLISPPWATGGTARRVGRELRARLEWGADGTLPIKPRAMYERTYQRILGMLDYHEAVRKQGAGYARKYRPDQHRAHLWRQCRNRFASLGGWPVRWAGRLAKCRMPNAPSSQHDLPAPNVRFCGRCWGLSGHRLLHCTCLLLTQSGNRPRTLCSI